MTPKEKALKLCQDFATTSRFKEFNEGYTLPLFIAKECALICVDEMLEVLGELNYGENGGRAELAIKNGYSLKRLNI